MLFWLKSGISNDQTRRPMNQSVSPARKNRVFVVDDHPIVRQGLALMINRESDLTVCGEAETAQAAVHAIPTIKPDILIVDISLNGPDGLDLLKDVRARYPDLPVLILSMHDESIYAERALRAGAQGYIMKQEATEKVLVALRRILNREIYVSERIANRMLQRYIGSRDPARPSSIADLTDRELEVFRLIGEGHSTRRIAEELHISVKTVESYQAHIKEKLSLRSARELVQHAIQWSVGEKTV
jgi:DNA-binding NarL/FixJ family response regulator